MSGTSGQQGAQVIDPERERLAQCPFGSPEMMEDPFPFLERMRHTEPVFWEEARNAYFLTRREEVEFAFLHPEIFSNEGRTPGHTYPGQRYETIADLAGTDPPEHTSRRALYLDLIGPRRVKQLQPAIVKKANSLIDSFVDEVEVNFTEVFAVPLPAWAMGWILGIPEDMHKQLDVWADEYFDLFDASLHKKGAFQETEEKLIPSFVEFTNFCGDLVLKWREDADADESLKAFAESTKKDGTPFSVDELANETRLMVTGGKTTQSLIAKAIVDVLRMEERGDMTDEKHVTELVEETLRRDGPATHIPRICVQEVELAGVTIPAGSRVFLSLLAANRDEAYYPCPAEFEPGRPNGKRHLGFGFGSHHCVGAPIARLEATVALMTMFDRFKEIRLSPRNDFKHNLELTALRGMKGVYLELESK